jgi:Tfp pilus assembly pilus retraction ATPase PilT
MDITQLLTFGVEQGASDFHLSAGEPPMLRIHGELKKLDSPALSKEEVHDLVFDMMNDSQRKIFQEKHECDFSFEMGEVARFRSTYSCSGAARARSSGLFRPKSSRWSSWACRPFSGSSAKRKKGWCSSPARPALASPPRWPP